MACTMLSPAAASTDLSLLAAADRFARLARALVGSPPTDHDNVPPELAEILAVLAEQEEWRVFIDGTANLGHQASTVTILRRLIDMTGYAGRVTVVFADHGRSILGCTAAKLALMFAGAEPARMAESITAYGSCRNIRFLPLEQCAELSGALAFGFTGGADDMSVNFALVLNVRFFMRLQPYLWDDPVSARDEPYYESSRIEQPDGKHFYLLEAYPELRHLTIRPPRPCYRRADPAIWRWYAEEQEFDEGLACRTRNVRAVVESENGQAGASPLLWALYGFQHFRDTAAEMLLTCVLAALRCQSHVPRSIVLCSFSPREELEGCTELVAALADDASAGNACLPALEDALARRHAREIATGRFSADRLHAWTRALGAWIFERNVDARILMHCGYDENAGHWSDISRQLDAALGQAQTPTVHIADLGPVPMDVFHQCMALGDLPGVIEGQATANLMISLGQPFLQILRAEQTMRHDNPNCTWTPEDAARVAATIGALLPQRWLASASTLSHQAYGAEIDRIAAFLLASLSPSDRIVPSESSGPHCDRNARDKLAVALLALRQVMLAGLEDPSTREPP